MMFNSFTNAELLLYVTLILLWDYSRGRHEHLTSCQREWVLYSVSVFKHHECQCICLQLLNPLEPHHLKLTATCMQLSCHAALKAKSWCQTAICYIPHGCSCEIECKSYVHL